MAEFSVLKPKVIVDRRQPRLDLNQVVASGIIIPRIAPGEN